ncbi:hypothetical protein ACHAQA_010034 [Verticillium albo-atrum]
MDDLWKPAVDAFAEWLVSNARVGIASVVAPAASGKSWNIPRAALAHQKPGQKVIYALPSTLEKGVFFDSAAKACPGKQECVADEFPLDALTRFWVVTHRALAKMLRSNKFPNAAVIIVDHDPSNSAQYVTLWMRLAQWAFAAPKGGYRRIATLSCKGLPRWQTKLNAASTVEPLLITMNVPPKLGWKFARKENLASVTNADSPEEAVEDVRFEFDYFKNKSSALGEPLMLFFGTQTAAIAQLSTLSQNEFNLYLVDGSKREIRRTMFGQPAQYKVAVVAPATIMSVALASQLQLGRVTHVVMSGHGETGARFDQDVGTVVHDTTMVFATDAEVERAGLCISADLEMRHLHHVRVFVPRWPVTAELSMALTSLEQQCAHRDVYSFVFCIVELCNNGLPWKAAEDAVVAIMPSMRLYEVGRRLIVMGCLEKAPAGNRCPMMLSPDTRAQLISRWLPAVNHNFSAAFLLAGVELAMRKKNANVEVQQTIIFMALIIANSNNCRRAIELTETEGHLVRNEVQQLSADCAALHLRTGFLWSCLGLWVASITSKSNDWSPNLVNVDRELFCALHGQSMPVFAELLGTRAIALQLYADKHIQNQNAIRVMREVFCSSVFRLFFFNGPNPRAFDVVTENVCSFNGPKSSLLSLNECSKLAQQDTRTPGFFVIASDNVRLVHHANGKQFELPDATLVHQCSIDNWRTYEMSHPSRPPRDEKLDIGVLRPVY